MCEVRDSHVCGHRVGCSRVFGQPLGGADGDAAIAGANASEGPRGASCSAVGVATGNYELSLRRYGGGGTPSRVCVKCMTHKFAGTGSGAAACSANLSGAASAAGLTAALR